MSAAAPGARGARPVEAVIFDYGGVISVRFLGDLGRFEAGLGYPPGSVTELMFGGPTDGRTVHDFHLLEMGRLPLADYLAGLTRRAPDAAVFVDDVEENVTAAAGVGLETVHFGPDPRASLADLDAILARRGVRTR